MFVLKIEDHNKPMPQWWVNFIGKCQSEFVELNGNQVELDNSDNWIDFLEICGLKEGFIPFTTV